MKCLPEFLTFRLVSDGEDSFGSELLPYEDSDDKLNVRKTFKVIRE